MRARIMRFATPTILLIPPLALLWFALAGGQAWLFGALSVAAAVAAGRLMLPKSAPRVSPEGLARFLAFFLRQSLEGGIDVAGRALLPGPSLTVAEHWRRVAPGPGVLIDLYIASTGLMPGTLACDFRRGRVLVHSITPAPEPKLDALEQHVRAIHAVSPGEHP